MSSYNFGRFIYNSTIGWLGNVPCFLYRERKKRSWELVLCRYGWFILKLNVSTLNLNPRDKTPQSLAVPSRGHLGLGSTQGWVTYCRNGVGEVTWWADKRRRNEWMSAYHEQLQQQHQQKQHALEPRLPWSGCSCCDGAVPPASGSCCTDICLFRISIRSEPMGCDRRGTTRS